MSVLVFVLLVQAIHKLVGDYCCGGPRNDDVSNLFIILSTLYFLRNVFNFISIDTGDDIEAYEKMISRLLQSEPTTNLSCDIKRWRSYGSDKWMKRCVAALFFSKIKNQTAAALMTIFIYTADVFIIPRLSENIKYLPSNIISTCVHEWQCLRKSLGRVKESNKQSHGSYIFSSWDYFSVTVISSSYDGS